MPKIQPGKAFLEAQNSIAQSFKNRQSINQTLILKSLFIEPRNGNGLYIYSICLEEKGQKEKSKVAMEKAISLNPCYYSSLKNDKEEIKKQILRNLSDASSMMKSKGHTNDFKWQEVVNMYAKKKDLNTCSLIIDLFQKVKKEDKQYSAHLFSTFGITLYEIGDYRQSLSKYKKACELKQSQYRYYNNMAILQYIFEKYQESTQLVAKSLIQNPGYHKSMFILSFSLCRLGKSEDALKHILDSIKKAPTMTMYRFKALTIIAQYFPLKFSDFDLQLRETERIILNNEDDDSYFYSKDNQEILKASVKLLSLHQKWKRIQPTQWSQYIQYLDDYLIKGHTDKYYLSLKMRQIESKVNFSMSQSSQSKDKSLDADQIEFQKLSNHEQQLKSD